MVNGILNVYKEKGYTSHDVVAKLRGIVGQKKIGHTGTLDPDAEGVLPVCLGRATKVCDMLTEKDKTYEAVLLLGKETDTQDISGTVLRVGETEGLTQEQVKDCVMSFVGEYDQIPPMYSALKVNGKKLYELAREGKTIERKSRKVEIKDVYRKRRDVMLKTMEETFPKEVKFTHPEGGLFTWCVLPEYMDAKVLAKQCLEKKVAYVPGGSFFPNGGKENHFRLNYSCMPEDKIKEGITRIAEVLKANLK